MSTSPASQPKWRRLGSINVRSGTLIVTDPCYLVGQGSQKIMSVYAGQYRVSVLANEAEVYAILAERRHTSAVRSGGVVATIGVDAGQVCLTDLELYADVEMLERCRPLVARPGMAGVSDNLAATLSGRGDGEYSLAVWYDHSDRICVVRVTFIGDPAWAIPMCKDLSPSP